MTPEPRLVARRGSLVFQAREEAAQDRIVGQRLTVPDFLAGVDVDHRRHRLFRGVGEARDLGRGHGERRLLHQHDVVFAGESGEQVRTQRRDDEQRGDADGRDLREK